MAPPGGEGGVREAQGAAGARSLSPSPSPPAVRRRPAREAPCLPRTVRECPPSGRGCARRAHAGHALVGGRVHRGEAECAGGGRDGGLGAPSPRLPARFPLTPGNPGARGLVGPRRLVGKRATHHRVVAVIAPNDPVRGEGRPMRDSERRSAADGERSSVEGPNASGRRVSRRCWSAAHEARGGGERFRRGTRGEEVARRCGPTRGGGMDDDRAHPARRSGQRWAGRARARRHFARVRRALRPRPHPASALAQAQSAGLTARRMRCPRECGSPRVPRARRGTGPAGCLGIPEAVAGHGVRALGFRRQPCRAGLAGAPFLPLRIRQSAPVRTARRETTRSTPRP